jgi:hypothetical protein
LQDFIRLSGGNPRYIADLIQEGSLKSLTGHTTPYSARAIVSTLVLTMTTEQFEVLSAAAIVGDRFSGEWLRAACRRDDETIASALQAALDRGIISESPHQHSFYTFTDNAVRRALYLSVVEFKRRIVHREVAVYLTERSNEEVTDAVAEHWDASGDLQKATTSRNCKTAPIRRGLQTPFAPWDMLIGGPASKKKPCRPRACSSRFPRRQRVP